MRSSVSKVPMEVQVKEGPADKQLKKVLQKVPTEVQVREGPAQKPLTNIQVLRKNGITELYHFTDASNLNSIRQHGLASWVKVDEKKLEARKGSTALSRSLNAKKGLGDFVRLSFCKRHPMMFVAVNEGRISRPVILTIQLQVVSRPGVLFCEQNAAAKEATASRDPGVIKFGIVRAKNKFGLQRPEVLPSLDPSASDRHTLCRLCGLPLGPQLS